MRTRPQIGGWVIPVIVGVVAFVALCYLPSQAALLAAMCAALGLVAVAEEDRLATANRVKEALSILQIPVSKAAEVYMDWDYREFKRALNCETKLDLWRLHMLGPEFRRVYAVLELRDLGAPSLFRRFLKIEPAIKSERSA